MTPASQDLAPARFFLTDAPADYDWGWTEQIGPTIPLGAIPAPLHRDPAFCWRGNRPNTHPLRLVRIAAHAADAQIARYGSGLHPAPELIEAATRTEVYDIAMGLDGEQRDLAQDTPYDALLDEHEDHVALPCGCVLNRPFKASGQPSAVGITFCKDHALSCG